jgi:AcrR family transcriptional regulator
MAEQTREAVLATAAELFSSRGWAGTSMRDIARRADVAVETVYATAGPKRELLLRVLDVAVVGDDAPVALAERPEFAALGVGDRRARVAAAAHLLTELNGRVAGLNRALAHGATADPGLTVKLQEARERQLGSYRGGIALVLGREPEQQLAEGIWAVGNSDCFLLLRESAGWSTEQYQAWLADTLFRLLGHVPEEET